VISETNKGTSFIIKLPLTLSIIQALLVKIGGETFAIPLGIIEKVIKIKDNDILKSQLSELYMYREKAVPVVRVNEKLGLNGSKENEHLILTLLGDQYYGLIVDELIGQQEIVIKKLNGILGKMKEYLGATILGNGDITLILDVGSICMR
jgi:Chemotaxis protein histidine kinase and related kinases